MASHKSSKVKRVAIYRGERDGVLFYILPPLLLGAVFAFCSMASDDGGKQTGAQPAAEASAAEESAAETE